MDQNGLVGRLTIPRKTLALALGHIPTTALPGQRGNVGVAGHRDKLFRSRSAESLEDFSRRWLLAGSVVPLSVCTNCDGEGKPSGRVGRVMRILNKSKAAFRGTYSVVKEPGTESNF
jgi:hypothetical protein